MAEAKVADLMRATLMAVMTVGGPMVLAAMIVGTLIALLQALTQVQEMTLTLVPKLVAIFAVIAASSSFMGNQMSIFAERMFELVRQGLID